jgi:hypothetical protein
MKQFLHLCAFVCISCYSVSLGISFRFWGAVEPSPLLLRPVNGVWYQSQMMMDDDECGAVGEMIGRGN